MFSKKLLSSKIFYGLSWSAASRVTGNIFQLMIYFVLARILQPSDFGVMAALTVFVNFSNLFATSGLNSANIQFQDLKAKRYPTIFYLSIYIGIACVILLYIFAPLISSFLNIYEDFDDLLRIYSITILLTSINSIQISELSKKLEFKKIFFYTTLPNIMSGIISIFLALYGWGIYSLIANAALARIFSIYACANFYEPFPTYSFSAKIAKSAFRFSSNIFLANLLEEAYRSSIMISIGKFYNSASLGFYNMGRQIPVFFTSTINATVVTVFFPVFSDLQNNTDKGKKLLRKTLRILNSLIFSLMCLIVLISDDLIVFLLTEKWLPASIYLKLSAILLGIYHIYNTQIQYINSLGLSYITFRFALITKILGLIVLFLTLDNGIEMILYGQIAISIFSLFVIAFPANKYINYRFSEQLSDFLPAFVINLIMFIFLTYLQLDFTLIIFEIIISTFIFITINILLTIIMNRSVIDDLKGDLNY